MKWKLYLEIRKSDISKRKKQPAAWKSIIYPENQTLNLNITDNSNLDISKSNNQRRKKDGRGLKEHKEIENQTLNMHITYE